MKKLKIGDAVLWRGCFGTETAKEATIKRIEKTVEFRSKYGNEVNEVSWDDYFVVTLENGHWAYNYQLSPIS